MSDTDDMWRAIRGLTDRLGKVEEWMSAQSNNHDELATAMENMERTIGTPDVDDRSLVELVDKLWTDVRSVEGAIGELSKQVADQHASHRPVPSTGAVAGDGGMAIHTLHVERLSLGIDADDRASMGHKIAVNLSTAHARERAARRRPVTPERIRDADGDELDMVADILGLARKSLDDHDDFETDESLRLRCAAAYFAQNMTTETAEMIAKEAAIACKTKHSYTIRADDPKWRPHPWVIDAVMAAASAVGRDSEDLAQAQARIAAQADTIARLQNTAERTLALRICERERDELRARVGALESWRGRLAKALDVKDDIHIIEAAATRIARDLGPVVAKASAEHAEMEWMRPLLTAIRRWRSAAGKPGSTNGPTATRGGESFFSYEGPLVDAYDEWVSSRGDPGPLSGL